MDVVVDIFAEVISANDVVDRAAELAGDAQFNRLLIGFGGVADKLGRVGAQDIAKRVPPRGDKTDRTERRLVVEMSGHTVKVGVDILLEAERVVKSAGNGPSGPGLSPRLGGGGVETLRHREIGWCKREAAECRIEAVAPDVGRRCTRPALVGIVRSNPQRQPLVELDLQLGTKAERLVRTRSVAHEPIVLRVNSGYPQRSILACRNVDSAFEIVGIVVAVAGRAVPRVLAEAGLRRQQIDCARSGIAAVEGTLRAL